MLGQLGSTCERAQQPAWLLLLSLALPLQGKHALPQQQKPPLLPWLLLWLLLAELPDPRWLPCSPPAPAQPMPRTLSAELQVLILPLAATSKLSEH